MPPDGGLGPVPLFEMAPACKVTAALKAAPVPGWPAQIMVATRIAEATGGA
jgi:hypothetical protein